MKFFNSLKDFIKSIDCLIVWVAISTSVTVTVMIILLQKFCNKKDIAAPTIADSIVSQT